MTTASKVTMIRIALIPFFMAAALLDFRHSGIVALVLFLLASATDGIDGYIARKYNQTTDFGKFIDPLADKLLVTSAMLIFVQWGTMPAWVLMVVLTREFAVSGLRMIAASKGDVIAAAGCGKIKTVVTIVCISVMLVIVDFGHVPRMELVNQVAIALILLTTLYSGIEYFAKNHRVLK